VPQIIHIADPADPRIEAYRDIKERDLVGRQGRFVAEGEVVLRTAIRSGRHPLESVLLTEGRVESLADALAGLPGDIPIYSAPQAILDGIVGFRLHRGILAIGSQGEMRTADELLSAMPDHAQVVVVMGVSNHDNVGGIFRNAAAFGVDAVLLDDTCCDPYYRKAIRVSVGATLIVPFARLGRGEDPVGLLDRHGFEAVALSPSGAGRLSDYAPAARTGLILGAEGPGLPGEVLAKAHTVGIPMATGFDSLNVATTSGIALHHLRNPVASGPVPRRT
jgi:tRNA G18 (ribose-2'-O)-methylase SpoU